MLTPKEHDRDVGISQDNLDANTLWIRPRMVHPGLLGGFPVENDHSYGAHWVIGVPPWLPWRRREAAAVRSPASSQPCLCGLWKCRLCLAVPSAVSSHQRLKQIVEHLFSSLVCCSSFLGPWMTPVLRVGGNL